MLKTVADPIAISPAKAASSDVSEALVAQVSDSIDRFVGWLDLYGEVSYDHQSFYAGPIGRAAKTLYYRNRKLGILAVSPMVLFEAFLPSARRLFWKPMRFPIADAHYASGFALLAQARNRYVNHGRAVHFLDALFSSRSEAYSGYAWGYPFDWVTMTGTCGQGTPFITTLPYIYEAFEEVYGLDGDDRWLHVMRSIARHANDDYSDLPVSAEAASCSYRPGECDPGRVVNASAYRAFLLMKASQDLGETHYAIKARRNLNFVLEAQNSDGSWFYSVEGRRDFVDHFHTCFVLKALAKIEALTGDGACASALERGVRYYVTNLIDANGLPKPFSRAPRMTVYKRELYDYAECINVAVLLRGRFPSLDRVLASVLKDLLRRWRKRDGSFRSRELFLGWDNVPMHRWAQSQLFRSLCFFVACETGTCSPSRVLRS